MFNRKVPVFIVNGFLESGKTTFIQKAILNDQEMKRERVVILCCEEGEVELENLPKNVCVHTIEDKEELTEELFFELNASYRPTCIIIEYNVMWGMKSLYECPMPKGWGLAEQFTIIDATTFAAYFGNMKSIFADMLRMSTRVYLKRCTRDDDFKYYKDNIKPCATRAELIYMSDEEGIMDIMLEEELPYDLNSDVITLNRENYTVWYIDMLDNVDRYVGKTVEYTAVVAKPDYFRKDFFMAGNMVMTCCEDDMQFLGFVCQYDNTERLEEGTYVTVRGEVAYEFSPEYEEEGPVIYASKVTVIPGQDKKKKKK
ncbi:MAG: GTPase [Ruminococcaceae bacterium]|nr:GTPase [Oscillospiraceae bacterium]